MKSVRNLSVGTFVPPPGIDGPAWDILLALYSDQRCELSLAKLAAIVSLPPAVLDQWLAALEERDLIGAAGPGFTQEMRPLLTWQGRELVDFHLTQSNDHNVGVRH